MKNKTLLYWTLVLVLGLPCNLVRADIPLIGLNIPEASLLDGDFDTIKSGWRQYRQSPHWKATVVEGPERAGLAEGRIASGENRLTVYESVVLDQNPACPRLSAGEVLAWRFAANAQYPCDGRVTFSLVFGSEERVLADRVRVPIGPAEPEVFEGRYTVSAEDAANGMPFARFRLESDQNINVYVDYVDLRVVRPEDGAPRRLVAAPAESGIALHWEGAAAARYDVYRSERPRSGFGRVAEKVEAGRWVDGSIVNGKTYYYAVKRTDVSGGMASDVVEARKVDNIPPAAPRALTATGGDWTVKLLWETGDADVASVNIYRGRPDGEKMDLIAGGIRGGSYEDMLPVKGVENAYAVEAIDFSGNTGPRSRVVSARVRAVPGASFSDLIRPIPIHRGLRSDLWGAPCVLPRDRDNGIEHPDWSYWGGRPVRDHDGRYHMLVVRWPESAIRGHWDWVNSTVVHAVSDTPTGPYVPTGEIAYSYADGHGHNADVMVLNDGRYLLYSLVNWVPTLLTSRSMSGPWAVEGAMQIEYDAEALGDPRRYQVERNLSGLQLEDGSMLFVTKFGRMIKSEDGLLGPYKVLTDVIQRNETIPEAYRKSNYEDPVMWRDEVQFHMIINAFLDYRAIYLRSPDGIHWKYDTGLAYTPNCTVYEDGTRTHWYKLERPHVLQDEFGRATHLSLAAIDVPKREDYGNDRHSSKNIILPLTVHRRLTVLNRVPVGPDTKEIRVLIRAEPGFEPGVDLDLASLRFGGSSAVNFGGGSRIVGTEAHADGMILVFDGSAHGLRDDDFAAKLIGRTRDGDLVVGFTRVREAGGDARLRM